MIWLGRTGFVGAFVGVIWVVGLRVTGPWLKREVKIVHWYDEACDCTSDVKIEVRRISGKGR